VKGLESQGYGVKNSRKWGGKHQENGADDGTNYNGAGDGNGAKYDGAGDGAEVKGLESQGYGVKNSRKWGGKTQENGAGDGDICNR
jgi:hypothetical protein